MSSVLGRSTRKSRPHCIQISRCQTHCECVSQANPSSPFEVPVSRARTPAPGNPCTSPWMRDSGRAAFYAIRTCSFSGANLWVPLATSLGLMPQCLRTPFPGTPPLDYSQTQKPTGASISAENSDLISYGMEGENMYREWVLGT